jgi:endonuclease/exonuclease/phosphatase family metal-dependent hydrolase
VDQCQLVRETLPDYQAVFAQNYDSPYLFWPLTRPHGASRSGLLTLSDCKVESAQRRSLPVETGLRKFLDLDRCYSVCRVPVENGRTLCLYAVHLSAYTADGTIATEQLEMLLADMAEEYAAGNYVVCGGDFNKDLLGDSAEIFGVSGEGQTWAQPFPTELLTEGFTLVCDAVSGTPSCRNTDTAYVPGETFVLTVDGFLVSDNVEVLSTGVIDTGFTWSDHNPAELKFSLAAP